MGAGSFKGMYRFLEVANRKKVETLQNAKSAQNEIPSKTQTKRFGDRNMARKGAVRNKTARMRTDPPKTLQDV